MEITTLCLDPDETHVVSGTLDGTIRWWSIVTGTCDKIWKMSGVQITSLRISCDGLWLSYGSAKNSEESSLCLWSIQNQRLERKLNGSTKGISSLSLSPDDRYLVTGGPGNLVRLWVLETGECKCLDGVVCTINCVTFSPNGKRIAAGGDTGNVYLWSRDTVETSNFDQMRILPKANLVLSVAISSDNRLVAAGSGLIDSYVHVWSAESGQVLCVFDAHFGDIKNILFHPENKRLVSASDTGHVYEWDLERDPLNQNRLQVSAHTEWVTHVASSKDGKYAISLSLDKNLSPLVD